MNWKKFKSKIRYRSLLFDRSFSSTVWGQFAWLLLVVCVFGGLIMLIGLLSPNAYNSSIRDLGRGVFFDTFFLMLDPGSLSAPMNSWYALAVALFGVVVFMGMFISVVSSMLTRRVENYRNGDANYRLKNHVLILGYNETVSSLIQSIESQTGDNSTVPEDALIVVATNTDAQQVRNEINHRLPAKDCDRVVVLHCYRTMVEDLKRVCADNACQIYIIGETNEANHDDSNMECLRLLGQKVLKDDGKKCFVYLHSQRILEESQRTDLGSIINGKALLFPYSYCDTWSQKVLVYGPENKDPQLHYEPIDAGLMQQDSSKHVHVIIDGLTDMGMAMAKQVAQLAHYPNCIGGLSSRRTRITIIDKELDDKLPMFRQCYKYYFQQVRYRYADRNVKDINSLEWIDAIKSEDSPYAYMNDNFMDQEWDFIQADFFDENVKKYIREVSGDNNTICNILLCGDDDVVNMQKAILIDSEVKDNANQILVCQKYNVLLIDKIADNKKVRPFGMLRYLYGDTLIEENCAKKINAKYYANKYNEDFYTYSNSRIEEIWNRKDCKIEKKWASIHQANMRFTHLRSSQCSSYTDKELVKRKLAESIEALSIAEHNRWLTERLLLGFRPYTKKEYDEWLSLSPSDRKVYCMNSKANKIHICIRHIDLLTDEVYDAANASHENDKALVRMIPVIMEN